MEFENILKLIDSVSKSSLSSFTLEEGDVKIVLEANKDSVKTVINEVTVDTANFSEAPIAATVAPAGKTVKAPLVGVFYSAPSPESEAFVHVGDTISKGQVLGIVEAMKLMNEIESEFEGVVEEILVENGQMVEYGQPLFVLR